jgi:hypothetical protein
MIKRVALVLVAAIALGLTPAERKAKLQKVREAVELGIQHGKNLQEAAEQARIETDNANAVARMAVDSAMTSDTKAKLAEALEKRQNDQAVALAKWKKENEPIIKAVTGPWWFPGGRALLYGAKKSAISAVVIIVGAFVLFLIIKVRPHGRLQAGRGAQAWAPSQEFSEARPLARARRQTIAFLFPTTGQDCGRQHQPPNDRTTS